MKRKPMFFVELEHYEEFQCGFFWDLEKAIRLEKQEKARRERYWERRDRNIRRAMYYYRKIKLVESIDPWKMTSHIEPDWFGNKKAQFDAVKKIIDRKNRILWALRGLYHYLAFDHYLYEVTRMKKLSYTSYRRIYDRLEEQHREKIKQAKWDAKRAKVRARRAKKKGGPVSETNWYGKTVQVFDVRFGSAGHQPPAPFPILENTTWD